MRRLIALALAAGVIAGGCGKEGDVQQADWDLARSDTIDDVEYPERSRDLQGADVRPDGPVRIALPAGATFSAEDGVINRIGLERDGDTLTQLILFTHPMSIDDAAALARRWAERFRLPVEPIDAWAAKARTGSPPRGLSSAPREARLGPGGPVPDIILRRLAGPNDPDKPVVVQFGLVWPDAGRPQAPSTEP